MDGNIDPRSVEAMEKFREYSKGAKDNMQALQQQMDRFTKSMAMTKAETRDLTESLRTMGNTPALQQTAGAVGLLREFSRPRLLHWLLHWLLRWRAHNE